MNWNKSQTKRKLNVRHQRMRNRTRNIRTANRLAVCILVVALCIAVPITALPKLAKNKETEEHINTYWAAQVKRAADAKDQVSREHRALEQDPLYLEIKAREYLNYSKEDEEVFIFPKMEVSELDTHH